MHAVKKRCRGWGDSSLSKVLATLVWGPLLDPQYQHKMPGVVACAIILELGKRSQSDALALWLARRVVEKEVVASIPEDGTRGSPLSPTHMSTHMSLHKNTNTEALTLKRHKHFLKRGVHTPKL